MEFGDDKDLDKRVEKRLPKLLFTKDKDKWIIIIIVLREKSLTMKLDFIRSQCMTCIFECLLGWH